MKSWLNNHLLKKLTNLKKYACGIDIDEHNISVVILSCYQSQDNKNSKTQIEFTGQTTLPAGTVSGNEIIDPTALSIAIPLALQTKNPNKNTKKKLIKWHRIPFAMALCPSKVMFCNSSISSISSGFQPARPSQFSSDISLDKLAPMVLDEAERLTGIERCALSVDWYQPNPKNWDQLTILITERSYIDIRVHVASAANIKLKTIDDASMAALEASLFINTFFKPYYVEADYFSEIPALQNNAKALDQSIKVVQKKEKNNIGEKLSYSLSEIKQSKHLSTWGFFWIDDSVSCFWIISSDMVIKKFNLPGLLFPEKFKDTLSKITIHPVDYIIIATKNEKFRQNIGENFIAQLFVCKTIFFNEFTQYFLTTQSSLDKEKLINVVALGLALRELKRCQ